MNQPFYKPRPVAPEDNRQMRGLRWSLWVSVAGWIIYGAFAYAFEDARIIHASVQSWMVLVGSALIVGGAESNTIATAEAALSKLGTDRISVWDYLAVIASLVGGIITPLIVFATRQPELAGTWWRRMAVRSGPLVLGVAGVLDFYGAVTELALSKRDYVQDLGQWLKEEAKWNAGHAQAHQPEAKSVPVIRPKAEPTPAIDQPLAIEDRRERVLGAMLAQEPPTRQELADQLGVSKSTVGNDVVALREAGRLNGRH